MLSSASSMLHLTQENLQLQLEINCWRQLVVQQAAMLQGVQLPNHSNGPTSVQNGGSSSSSNTNTQQATAAAAASNLQQHGIGGIPSSNMMPFDTRLHANPSGNRPVVSPAQEGGLAERNTMDGSASWNVLYNALLSDVQDGQQKQQMQMQTVPGSISMSCLQQQQQQQQQQLQRRHKLSRSCSPFAGDGNNDQHYATSHHKSHVVQRMRDQTATHNQHSTTPLFNGPGGFTTMVVNSSSSDNINNNYNNNYNNYNNNNNNIIISGTPFALPAVADR